MEITIDTPSHNLTAFDIRPLRKTKKTEIYNFQKLSAVLADYGFCTIKLQDDWHGADLIAQNMNFDNTNNCNVEYLKIQLKGEAGGVFNKKYEGKGIWIVLPYKGDWYLYPHDAMYKVFAENFYGIKNLYEQGKYDAFIHTGRNDETNISKQKLALLQNCKLTIK